MDFKNLDVNAIDHILEYTGDAGLKVITQLNEIYSTTTKEMIDDMKSSIDQNDLVSLCRFAHTLKSSSNNVGAFKIAKVCEYIETKLVESNHSGNGKEFIVFIDQILEDLPLTLQELNTLVDDRKSNWVAA